MHNAKCSTAASKSCSSAADAEAVKRLPAGCRYERKGTKNHYYIIFDCGEDGLKCTDRNVSVARVLKCYGSTRYAFGNLATVHLLSQDFLMGSFIILHSRIIFPNVHTAQ